MSTTQKEKRVEVFIPRGGEREDPNYFVAVNGKTYLLPKGKKSMVPDFVAAEIQRSEAAKDKLYDMQESLRGRGGQKLTGDTP